MVAELLIRLALRLSPPASDCQSPRMKVNCDWRILVALPGPRRAASTGTLVMRAKYRCNGHQGAIVRTGKSGQCGRKRAGCSLAGEAIFDFGPNLDGKGG